ncbi:MAG: hypothetical protein Q8764_00205 [Pigeon pea little leaf phytoplasma]|uniref:Preprotein translocase subunit SecE n=1 Tax=Candidatus Phytoplasma fabacearum TaxID=2982628 RepID=A0ABU8ZSU7_9MOLU|nr:hypothetical protein ['Bituminaria bituminosa' little leaf phytoplasma]MDV3148632.1 hypothetical protein [Pigeon pea little leaf phytoplasma]MDO7983507.1 hypothetical protein ['Bituminaria bituminosa' little leaf phytoplasma]MDO8023799.1 hypothetical protein ['Bituminaria bituminosa' little leaf phytoplasma]MDO8030627.1 hypothetical protein ['Bituminaria bituminosa' little leaf phytoplasma]MDV3154194.1 hypothetical protein [Pigeon pea little leaf phytoplasma]
MAYKKFEEKPTIPLMQVLKEEYSIINIFCVILSMVFLGVCCNCVHQFSDKLSISLLVLSIVFFLISIFPFIRKIFCDFRFISFPTKIQIFKQIIQVFVFTVILIFILNLFQYCYDIYMISLLKKF